MKLIELFDWLNIVLLGMGMAVVFAGWWMGY